MKSLLNKDIPSVIFVLSITIFDIFLAVASFGVSSYNAANSDYNS